MADKTITRSIDEGSYFLVHEEDPRPACGYGVCVETRFDSSTPDAITLSLRRAHWHDLGPADVEMERAHATVSLRTGRCSALDPHGERFLAEHTWLSDSLGRILDWLRLRARRATAQRDRTTCFPALEGAEPGTMIPHDELFPHDWDLLFKHEGRSYLAIEHHCPSAACPCTDVVVELLEMGEALARHIGELRIDFKAARLKPKASSPLTAKLFKPLWAKHGADRLMRYGEVRRAVQAHAAARTAVFGLAKAAPPARNAPCPCGSGKKYKRCCVTRNERLAPSGDSIPRVAR